ETIGLIEAGRRTLDMWEFLWLRRLFPNLGYVDFLRLDPSDEPIAINPTLIVDSGTLPSFFRDGRANPHRRGDLQIATRIAESQDAAIKAARKLGVDPETIQTASLKLWNRSLTQERDDRLTADPDVSTRSRQALRGHVTRELISELQQEIKPTTKTKTRRK